MATVSKRTSDSLAVGFWADAGEGESQSKSDRYLAARLAAASADYKGVAITTFLLGLGVALLLWLSAGIMLEHWCIAGGLPRWARWTWFATGCAALVAAVGRWVLPLLRCRVNLVYAAHAIEQEHPGLYNDLVNAVLVKAHPEGSVPMVVKSLEHRAAKRLSAVPNDVVMDRTTAVRLAYCLALLVGLACIYQVAAPKSLLVSATRLLLPWVGLSPPSRVRIDAPILSWRLPAEATAANRGENAEADSRRLKTDSGVATLVRGRQLLMTTVIRGLHSDEKPIVSVAPLPDPAAAKDATASATAAAKWQVAMQPGRAEVGAAARFTALLPDQTRGLDQSIEITIKAGDAHSLPVRIAVIDSPSLLVREVRYDYPDYTQRENETVEWQGDVRGIEGTQVTIIAESNQPLESAWIDFDCDDKRDVRLKVGASDLARATGTFSLRMNAERTAAEHSSYRLLFQLRGGAAISKDQVVAEKLEHRIEVTADLEPEVSIEEPRESPLRVPPGKPVTVRVLAVDPDFGLAHVGIETRVNGGAIQPEIVLLGREKKVSLARPFRDAAQLVPEQLGATAGDLLEYRAVAIDTRPQVANVSRTPWQSLRIDASAPTQPNLAPPPSPSDSAAQKASDDPQSDDPKNPRGPNAAKDTQQDAERKDVPPQDGGAQQQQQQQQQQEKTAPEASPQEGKKSGGAQGEQDGKQPAAGENKQPGAEQGQGKPQGQGAQQGQGLGAEGNKNGAKQSGEKQAEGKSGPQSPSPQAAGKQSDGKQPPRTSVASDGTNDGAAMERILEHRRQAKADKDSGGAADKGGEKQKPDGAKPDGAKPDGAKPDGAKPDGAKPDGAKPDGAKPDGAKPDGAKPDGAKPDGAKPDGAKPDGAKPDGAK
ncbi:MAG: hypothetical protein NT089_07780, partial [Planctomycetia bacterium]|nr:hypothetical protein [Planctomycetia bacterium]